MIVGLEEPSAGHVALDGVVLRGRRRDKTQRRDLQMMFQDPFASLDPRMRVSSLLREPLRIAGELGAPAQRARVRELLDQVGLSSSVLEKLPGRCQVGSGRGSVWRELWLRCRGSSSPMNRSALSMFQYVPRCST
ncbi:hypothetical protein KAE78_12170 [Microbacterium sp. NIBRBAC000506063]|nr:hypothetical protein KAE78_12170 [Microbacterium sp. NIBRBAC000506063]